MINIVRLNTRKNRHKTGVSVTGKFSTGVVYKAVAEDEDLGLTCPLGPGRNTRCPCASVRYHLLTPGRGQTIPHSLFTIHASSGQVFLRPGTKLEPSARYQALIVASS